jgi:hypothetical protein
VSGYRTPEERREEDEIDARIERVIQQAVRDGGACKAAMTLDEPPEVVERWIDTVWDGLRDSLDDEDRLRAIMLLLGGRMDREANEILRSVGGML